MASDRKYDHLKVTPAEDAEVVIQAGIPETEPEFLDDSSLEEKANSIKDADKELDKVSDKVDVLKSQKDKDDYHATDLDDIASAKMSAIQIIVIAVALICVCVFILWYLLFQ